MMPFRVLLADDHEIFRRGVRNVLAADTRVRVVGEAGSPHELVASVVVLGPDALVVGPRMLEAMSTGPEAGRVLGSSLGPPRDAPAVVAVVAVPEDASPLLPAPHARTVPEEVSAADLVDEVVRAARARSQAPRGTRVVAEKSSEAAGVADLTRRELEVVAALCRGRSNAQIARSLSLAEGTVKVHLARIMAKKGARSRVELVIWAFRSGLVR